MPKGRPKILDALAEENEALRLELAERDRALQEIGKV